MRKNSKFALDANNNQQFQIFKKRQNSQLKNLSKTKQIFQHLVALPNMVSTQLSCPLQLGGGCELL
jgi:hypothetical protein